MYNDFANPGKKIAHRVLSVSYPSARPKRYDRITPPAAVTVYKRAVVW